MNIEDIKNQVRLNQEKLKELKLLKVWNKSII